MLNDKPLSVPELSLAGVEAFARGAGLRYVKDHEPGFTRRRRGKGFIYLDHERARISNEDVIQRIRKLAIPPAWEGVWICRHDNGHLQATGRDVRERKQYRYHPVWAQSRNETKFSKLHLFGTRLPKIRARVEEDLQLPGFPKEKVLAAVVRVMELTNIRVGNDIYAEENDSYGLTTIRNEHAEVKGSKVNFHFRGKSGIVHDLKFRDPRLGKIIRRCQELPGEELFGYVDEDGQPHDIGSSDVNEYLREISGEAITAKDFRTWGGTTHAIETLAELGPCLETTKKARKTREVGCYKCAAAHLGNTVAVCRKYYVHPVVFEADVSGELHKLFKKRNRGSGVLRTSERVLMDLLG